MISHPGINFVFTWTKYQYFQKAATFFQLVIDGYVSSMDNYLYKDGQALAEE